MAKETQSKAMQALETQAAETGRRLRTKLRHRGMAIAVAVFLLASLAGPAGAALQACVSATPTVNSAAELDAAIGCYNSQTPAGDHTIMFGSDFSHPGATAAITQNNPVHKLTFSGGFHTLTGPGHATIPGNINLFTIDGDGSVAFDDLTITGADFDAILIQLADSHVTIDNTTIRDGRRGVVNVGGSLVLSNSTVSNNLDRGILASSGETVISNSTITNNNVGVGGSTGSTVAISNSTISNSGFAGISVFNSIVTVESSIVIGDGINACTAAIVDGGNNFASDATCGAGFVTLAPSGSGSLGALADNGGPTMTQALLSGSNAVDAGDCTTVAVGIDAGGIVVNGDLAWDQRGPGFPRTDDTNCDAGAFEAPTPPSFYVAVNPARILDSRAGSQVGVFGTPWTAGQTRQVDVTGVGGIPTSGVEAVVINVTTVSPSAGFSWLTISPTGEPAGTTAAHNFGTDSYTTELSNDVVIAKVGTGGTIDIRNETGTVDLVIDIVGYYSSTGAGYVGLSPARILDSRPAHQVGVFASPWASGQTRQVDVTGVGGVPASGVEAVVLNVTSVAPTAGFSWLTISPTGSPAGTTAAHNFGTDSYTTELVNDVVIAKVGTGGTIDIRNQTGNVDLVIDVVGYYTPTGGDGFFPLNPSRILDSRNITEGDYNTPWTTDHTRNVETTFGTCATAVVLHITSVSPTAALSWLTVSPAGAAGGTTAAHNFGTASYTSEIANDLVIAKTGTEGDINIRNETGDVDLVIDLVGYYGNCNE